MSRATVTVTTEIDIDVDMAAKWFANVSDELQTQFFKKVCEYARADWRRSGGGLALQWLYIGSHLGDCECSSEDAREMIRHIHYAMEDRIKNPLHKPDAA